MLEEGNYNKNNIMREHAEGNAIYIYRGQAQKRNNDKLSTAWTD